MTVMCVCVCVCVCVNNSLNTNRFTGSLLISPPPPPPHFANLYFTYQFDIFFGLVVVVCIWQYALFVCVEVMLFAYKQFIFYHAV